MAAGTAAAARATTAIVKAEHQASGSAVVVEDASTPDDVAVGSFGTDSGAGNGPSPQPHDAGPNPVSVTDTSLRSHDV